MFSIKNKFQHVFFLFNHPLNNSLKRKIYTLKRLFLWYLLNFAQDEPLVANYIGGLQLLTKRKVGGGPVYLVGLDEFEDMSFIAHVLRKGDVFIDVGANVGSYSLLAAKICGTTCIAFEPADKTFDLLKKNVHLNILQSLIEIRNVAIGNKKGRVTISNDFGPGNHILAEQGDANNNFMVDQITLDELIDENIDPTVIKIDVEGYEANVIEGAEKILNNKNLLAILIEKIGLGNKFGFNENELHKKIEAKGFKPYTYNPFSKELLTINNIQKSIPNVIYIKNIDTVKNRLASSAHFFIMDGNKI